MSLEREFEMRKMRDQIKRCDDPAVLQEYLIQALELLARQKEAFLSMMMAEF
jgi:hypothetical protein